MKRGFCESSPSLRRRLETWTSSVFVEPNQFVVPVELPEAALIMIEKGELGDPLGRLPEVQMGHQQPDRPAVITRQRLPVEAPDHPGLTTPDVIQGQIRGVSGRRGGQQMTRRRQRPGGVEQRVDAHPAEPGVELGPRGHAVDGTRVLRLRQPVHLVPGPDLGCLDQAVDGHRPPGRVDPRGDLGGQHGKVGADVVLARRQILPDRSPTAEESPLTHRLSLSAAVSAS